MSYVHNEMCDFFATDIIIDQ